MLNLLCKVGFHDEEWVYDVQFCGQCGEKRSRAGSCEHCGHEEPLNCVQTSTCGRCGENSSAVWHSVKHWTSNGVLSRTMSAVCERCGQIITYRSYQAPWT